MKQTWKVEFATADHGLDFMLVSAEYCYQLDDSTLLIDNAQITFNDSIILRVEIYVEP